MVLRGSPTFSFIVINSQPCDVFFLPSLDNEQFLCDNFFVANIFGRVHGKTNTCQQFKYFGATNAFGQQRYASSGRLGTINDSDYLLHFI